MGSSPDKEQSNPAPTTQGPDLHYASGLWPGVRPWPIDIDSNARLAGEVECFLAPKSWWWTCGPKSWLGLRMDEIDAELLRLIYTKVGAIMEDASVIALELGGHSSTFLAEPRDKLASASRSIAALVKAADAVHD